MPLEKSRSYIRTVASVSGAGFGVFEKGVEDSRRRSSCTNFVFVTIRRITVRSTTTMRYSL
jgi:hypothetical protein